MDFEKSDSKGCITCDDKNLIKTVIDKFADYSATDLVGLTHNQSPWIDSICCTDLHWNFSNVIYTAN